MNEKRYFSTNHHSKTELLAALINACSKKFLIIELAALKFLHPNFLLHKCQRVFSHWPGAVLHDGGTFSVRTRVVRQRVLLAKWL